MSRRLSLFAITLFLASPLVAACNLTMTINCVNGACTATTTNNGGATCSGEFITAILADVATGQATVSNFHTTLGLAFCFDSSSLPSASAPFGACVGDASLAAGSSFTSTANVQSLAGAPSPLPVEGITIVVDTDTGELLAQTTASTGSAVPTCTPVVSVPPVIQSGVQYTVSWTAVSDPNATFTVEESTSSD